MRACPPMYRTFALRSPWRADRNADVLHNGSNGNPALLALSCCANAQHPARSPPRRTLRTSRRVTAILEWMKSDRPRDSPVTIQPPGPRIENPAAPQGAPGTAPRDDKIDSTFDQTHPAEQSDAIARTSRKRPRRFDQFVAPADSQCTHRQTGAPRERRGPHPKGLLCRGHVVGLRYDPRFGSREPALCIGVATPPSPMGLWPGSIRIAGPFAPAGCGLNKLRYLFTRREPTGR